MCSTQILHNENASDIFAMIVGTVIQLGRYDSIKEAKNVLSLIEHAYLDNCNGSLLLNTTIQDVAVRCLSTSIIFKMPQSQAIMINE